MTYHNTTLTRLKTAPSTSRGVRLGRLAVRKGVSVQDIAERIGASRTTVYSWFSGGSISHAYQHTIENLIKELRTK